MESVVLMFWRSGPWACSVWETVISKNAQDVAFDESGGSGLVRFFLISRRSDLSWYIQPFSHRRRNSKGSFRDTYTEEEGLAQMDGMAGGGRWVLERRKSGIGAKPRNTSVLHSIEFQTRWHSGY